MSCPFTQSTGSMGSFLTLRRHRSASSYRWRCSVVKVQVLLVRGERRSCHMASAVRLHASGPSRPSCSRKPQCSATRVPIRRLRLPVATEVVRQKFSKAEGCAAKLRATGTRLLAEASESDRIWGIGVRWNDPRCTVPAQWRGSNILGYALMQVRDLHNNRPKTAETSAIRVS
eukprot:COSAG06_NODE_1813_length_8305_cov_5.110407_16_plen_173_part_00